MFARAGTLSNDDRELVVPRGLEGRSFDEIAARLRVKLAQGGPVEFLL